MLFDFEVLKLARLDEFRDTPFRTRFRGWAESEGGIRFAGSAMFYVQSGPVTVRRAGGLVATMPAGSFGSLADAEIEGGSGIVIEQPGFRAFPLFGGPIEPAGRLRYIDGCTDSMLVPPIRMGDPCLNHLHFPHGISQTMHTHPSDRLGLVARGRGRCVTPKGETPLVPGYAFVIPTDAEHCFFTDTETMDVIAFHPDSDWGPTDQVHPMVNRTIVDGISASLLPEIQTKEFSESGD